MDMKEAFERDVTDWLQQGKIQYQETVIDGIDQLPTVLVDVLRGHVFGKAIVRVAQV